MALASALKWYVSCVAISCSAIKHTAFTPPHGRRVGRGKNKKNHHVKKKKKLHSPIQLNFKNKPKSFAPSLARAFYDQVKMTSPEVTAQERRKNRGKSDTKSNKSLEQGLNLSRS